MNIMPTRYEMLTNSLNVYKETGTFFLVKDNNNYAPLWGGDDLGIYYFVTKIAIFFDLDITTALKIFFSLILFVGWITSITYFIFYKKSGFAKGLYVLISITFLVISSYIIGDVYILYAFVPIFVIPLFLVISNNKSLWLYLFFIIIGILIGYSNLIRSHSGSLAGVFIFFYLFVEKNINLRKKIIFLIFISIGILIPKFHFSILLKERDSFLREKQAYIDIAQKHVFWHNTFLGLAFIHNKYGIYPSDTCAENIVKNKNPKIKYFSQEYEEVLKNEFFKFVIKHPGYVITNYSAKMGVILMFILVSLNIGVYYVYRRRDRLLIPFFASLFWGILPGLIFLPYNSYLLGGISTAVLMSNYYITKVS